MGLNVAFLGNFTIEKGSRIFKELVLSFEKRSHIQWFIFGGIGDYESFFRIRDYVVSLGHYARDDLPKLIQRHQVEVLLLLSVWPETYSYTMSEAIILGLPFIATDIGALGERAHAYGCGLMVPLQNVVNSTASLLLEILDKPWMLDAEREKILSRREKLKRRATFALDVKELYGSLLPVGERKKVAH